MPVTDAEIDEAVTAELMAQYQDAQAVLGAAPESFLGATVPEFLGRAGTASTDEVGLPLAIASLGIGEMANVGRVILTEAGLSVLGEAATLPAQVRMAERLGIEPPDPAVQLAFAAVIGGAVPAGIYGATRGLEFGAGRLAGLSNREVVEKYRKVDLAPAQRAAVNRIETAAAETETGPQARPSDGPAATDAAIEDMREPGVPPAEPPALDTAKVEAVATPPPADLPEPPPASDRPATAQLATPGTGRVVRSLESNVTNLIVGAEGGGAGWDAFSDYSVIFPQKPVTSMTLDEIDAFQSANIAAGAESSAIGGPQFIRGTLRELRERVGYTGAEVFTPEVQQRLAVELMREVGLEDFKAGRISADEFADNLATKWAGLPLADGTSVYAGDGLNAATVDRATVIAVLAGQEYQTAARAMPSLRRVPASGLRVDARTYQFRTEVNEEGVGVGLDRVSEWSDLLAGDFIIHERLDGTRYVADGHHRTSLAARLMREGHAPIDVNAYIFREADGFTVDEVRARAAIKNIEAGSASAVDAAKVLRVDPAMIQQLSLRQSQVRDARGLMQLGDEAFDMVTAGAIREDFAATVGELTRDGTMQSAILRALIQGKPANQAEARQMAADAYRSGLARRDADAQGSLFGDEFDVAETLFRERAKVMAAALAKLRKDRSVFNTLVKEAGRIREAGNALTDEQNLARVGTDEQALAIIERLANRAGPVDDALNGAAQTARSGRIADGVEQFLGVVRGAIEGGDLQRLIDGPPRSRPDGEGAEARAPEGAGEQPDEVAAAEEALYRALLERETSPDRAAELTPAVLEAVEKLRAVTPRLDDFDAIRERAEQRAFDEADRQTGAAGDLFGGAPEAEVTGNAEVTVTARNAVTAAPQRRGAVSPYAVHQPGEQFVDMERIEAEGGVDPFIIHATDDYEISFFGWEDEIFGPNAHFIEFHHVDFRDGGPAVQVEVALDGSRLIVENIRRHDFSLARREDFNTVGPRRMRQLLRAYKAMAPEIETVSGLRVGGARQGGEYRDTAGIPAEVPISRFLRGGEAPAEMRPTPTEPVTPELDTGPSIPPGTEGMVSIGDNEFGEVFEMPDGHRALRTDDGAVTLEPEGERQPQFFINEDRDELAARAAEARRAAQRRGAPATETTETPTPEAPARETTPEAARASGETRTEATAAGEQTLIEGVAPITGRDRAEAAQNRPMQGGTRPLDEGLFDLGARQQMDLLEMARQPETPATANLFDDASPDTPEFEAQIIALEDELADVLEGREDFEVETGAERIGERGEAEAETITASAMIADLNDDTEFLEALDVCKP